jgi:hypothetical protein
VPTAPKPPGQRRRRNLDAPRWRTFDAGARKGRVPPLPARRPAWSASTRAWWRRVWRSPMSAAYLEADLGALFRLAELVELFARGSSSASLIAEQRQLEDRFGLSPKARQLLQWQVLAAGAGDSPASSSSAAASGSSSAPSNVRRLRAVDPKAAAS